MSSSMTKTLIVHIGIGKAGSTAIQKYLRAQKETLKQNKIHYWGLNFEHTTQGKPLFPWHTPGGIGLFQKLPDLQAREELRISLSNATEAIPEEGCAVWSNESIYERPKVYIDEIKYLASHFSLKIHIIAYARGHRDYANSAYRQWGIKHKTYPGSIMGFSDWIKSKQGFLSYGKNLSHWDQAFPDSFKLINYDILSDVVQDFIKRLPQCEGNLPMPNHKKENVTPADIPMALYALYNNQFAHSVLPTTISSLLSRYKLGDYDYKIGSLSKFYPSSEDLRSAESLLKNDISLVNTILARHNQPPLRTIVASEPVSSISDQTVTGGVLSILLTIIVEQERRLDALESRLATTKAAANT